MNNYIEELNLFGESYSIEYELDINGEPTISKEELNYMKEFFIEKLLDTEGYKNAVSQFHQDMIDGEGDYLYDLRKDKEAEARWDIED